VSLRFRRTAISSLYRIFALVLFAGVTVILCLSYDPRALAQNPSDQPGQEVVANLAAGRVVVAVVKDAILIATVENPFEAQTHTPTPVPLSGQRAGVLLGAIDWFSPSASIQIARLDRELPRLHGRVSIDNPKLSPALEGTEATDIVSIGQGLGDRLNEVVKDLHAQMKLPEGEPLVELVVADIAPGYGPEVWHVDYSFEQYPQRGDFWETRIPRPRYLQDWPPEKGQPRTLMEFDYPPGMISPTLLEMLRQKDPRLEKLSISDSTMFSVASMLLNGSSNKIKAADATQFLRAAIQAISPPNSRETMASIGLESGFAWIVQPPNEPKPAVQQKERPADAPTLIKPSGN
jgi:hypothetical protein